MEKSHDEYEMLLMAGFMMTGNPLIYSDLSKYRRELKAQKEEGMTR